jgi:DNA polymerase-3 subunit delta'
MAFTEFGEQQPTVALLQRSLERGRLGHAYLLTGGRLADMETFARTLAKTLNCQSPPRRSQAGAALDSCDQCLPCRKIDGYTHADVQWVRPESKSRVILVEQMRDLMQSVHLKPTEAQYKVAVIVAADRLNVQAANAFLKTLEEPPARSVLVLLTTEPLRLLETVVSRCLRLNLGGDGLRPHDLERHTWVRKFGEVAAAGDQDLLGRYRLLGLILAELAQRKAQIEKLLTAESPLQRYEDVEPALRDKWEDELAAAIEAEYRRERVEVLGVLQWWLRDVWLDTLRVSGRDATFPDLAAATRTVAKRLSPRDAVENLRGLERMQWLLGSNVQEALTLEVGLLKLKL